MTDNTSADTDDTRPNGPERIADPTTLELAIDHHTYAPELLSAFLDDSPVTIGIGDHAIEDCLIADYDPDTGRVCIVCRDDVTLAKQPTDHRDP